MRNGVWSLIAQALHKALKAHTLPGNDIYLIYIFNSIAQQPLASICLYNNFRSRQLLNKILSKVFPAVLISRTDLHVFNYSYRYQE